jgi:hypothetical protein
MLKRSKKKVSRCLCSECKTPIDVLEDVDLEMARWKNEELAELTLHKPFIV